MINDLILDILEIEKHSPTYPYIFRLKKHSKELIYFGASHAFDINSPQFDQIKMEFEKLKPDLVLWEGSVNMDLSSEENSKKQGEAVYINWLAKINNVESKNLDVPIVVDANYQAEKFTKEASFTFFSLRHLNTLYRRMEQGQEVSEKTMK